MKPLRFVFLIALVAGVFPAAPANADPYSGLWVGTATLKSVSEVNKQYADLRFDLGLAGVKAYDTLIAKGDTWQDEGSGTWRNTFDVSLPNEVETPFDYYSDVKIQVWGEGSIVLTLNGAEILRYNLTASEPYEFRIPATSLNEGAAANELVAEVQNPSFDLEMTAAIEEPQGTELIPVEAGGWEYNDSGTDPGPGWYNEPSGWTPDGQGPFGYGEGDEQTPLSTSASTVYFRRTFPGNSADFTHLRVLLLRDDGAVVCVNGIEILRSNMPEGTIEHGTPPVKALGASDEGRFIVVDVDAPTLSGTNWLAVELHQHPAELGGSGGAGQGALTRTAAPLDLRLLLHVDEGGTVRLLKEVIQVCDDASDKYVLLTDHTLVPNYTGVAVRDGVPVGRRLSAVGFDFAGTARECGGSGVSPGGQVTCAIELGSGHPTNPFLHRYHPDHDNWDERYESPVVEAYPVSRQIELVFLDRYPPDEDLPERAVTPAGWGLELLGGYYTETLSGLHKDDITVHGPFILRRVVTTDTLTQ